MINTIEDAIFMGIKNDVSCILDSYMELFEEQSTVNPNAPIRGLIYFGKLYENYIDILNMNRYGTRLLKLPTPRYFVLYLGTTERPDKEIMRLSDAFIHKDERTGYEWIATVLNINTGHNKKLLEACRVLNEYSLFVDCARKHLRSIPKQRDLQCDDLKYRELRKQAMIEAVDECIGKGILRDFLIKNKAEVVSMYLTEWNEEAAREVWRQESFEDGKVEGKIEGKIEEREEINELFQCLIRDNRMEDLKRAVKDKKFQDSLLTEYGIGTHDNSNKERL